MTKKSHKVSSSDSKLITLKLEEKCRLENQNNNNNIDKQEGLEGTKVRKEGSIKHLGITLTASPTIQHTDLLHFIAKKERKVLELREELKRNEEELSLLKKKWETIFTNQIINSPVSPINNNKDNEDNNYNNNNNNAITATNGDRNKQDGNGKENENANGVGVGENENDNDNDNDDQSDDVEVIKLVNGLSKGIVGVVNGIKNVAESEVTQEKLLKIRTVVADVANYEPVKQTKKMTFDFTSHAFDNITKGFSSIAQSETIRNARRKTLETVYQLNEVLAPTSPPSHITSNNSIYASSPISTSPPPLPSTSTFSSSSSSTFSSSSSPSSTTSTNPNSPKTPIQQTWSPTSQTFGAFTIQNSKQSDEIISSTTTTTKTTTKSEENNYGYNEESLYLFNELF